MFSSNRYTCKTVAPFCSIIGEASKRSNAMKKMGFGIKLGIHLNISTLKKLQNLTPDLKTSGAT